MFIDFSHVLQFPFDTTGGFNFVTAIVKEFHRFEPFLRKALLQLICDIGS
jgi:DNA replication licensing factor MCM6